MIFVDTSAWYATVMPSDPNHTAAAEWWTRNDEPVVTTDYVIDETLTLLRTRGHFLRAVAFGRDLFGRERSIIHFLTEEDVIAAWQVFESYQDKAWSFTDCSSKTVMERLAVRKAFAFDHHFHQFGTVTVVP